LGENVEDVKESTRLVDSPVTLVAGSMSMDPQMEKMMQMLDKNFSSSKRILEINMSHKLLQNIHKLMTDGNEAEAEKYVSQLYDGALLMEGYLKSPSDYVKRMTEIMIKATEK